MYKYLLPGGKVIAESTAKVKFDKELFPSIIEKEIKPKKQIKPEEKTDGI